MASDCRFSSSFSASGLTGARGERWLFEGLDLALAPGDLLVIIGPNGSGKTTLLRILAGLLAPVEGEVSWGSPPGDEAPRVHYLGHHNSVKGALSVAANLAFWQRLAGVRDEAALAEAEQALALERLMDLPARVLSAGQKRRLALARLVAVPAPLWLLDEPTTALDTRSSQAFGEVLRAHQAAGGMAIVATHQDLGIPPTQRLDMTDASEGAEA